MPWFAVRCFYLVGQKPDELNIFEERIVGYSAHDSEVAHEKAFQESKQYARESGFTRSDFQEHYEQTGDPLIEGYELWSQFFEARLSLEEFVQERSLKYEYHPE